MLLCHQKGRKGFRDVRTVNHHLYPTNRSACDALGLLGDDKEWETTLEDWNLLLVYCGGQGGEVGGEVGGQSTLVIRGSNGGNGRNIASTKYALEVSISVAGAAVLWLTDIRCCKIFL
ncbi:DNA helicase [Artemisia annua]|uniref:DNA helicase n=1 Tax=Artemisia annua TaxID=35608 RepID=A0A2U1LET5_ARTAN|nr:DNA helicase [Artemisia annua]